MSRLVSDTDARVAETTAPGSPGTERLLSWNELPHWQQDNHYILTHYRPASYSFARSFASIFYLHNESVNIWSHLLGAAVFVYEYMYTCYPSFKKYEHVSEDLTASSFSATDLIAFSYFFVGALTCLSISAAYHACSNHSPRVARFGNQLDYVGIVALITGSFIPTIYYGFYCDPWLQKGYWTMISMLGVGCTIVSLDSRFRSPVWRPFRAGMFVAMGLSAVFPILHGLRLSGWRSLEAEMGLSYVVCQGAFYIIGAGMYAVSSCSRDHRLHLPMLGINSQRKG